MVERDYNLEITVEILLEKYLNKMTNEGAHFRSELKRWYDFWERKLNNVNGKIQGTSKTRKKVDGKPGFIFQASPNGIIEDLDFADTDIFLNIPRLLIFWETPTIEPTEAKRAVSGIRQLKTPYWIKMGIRE